MQFLITAILALILVSCGGGGSASTPSTNGIVLDHIQTAPYIALNQGGGSVEVSVYLTITKSSTIATAMRVTYGSSVRDYQIRDYAVGTSGSLAATFQMDTTKLGSYTINVQLLNNQTPVSGIASAILRVGPSLDLPNILSLTAGGTDFILKLNGVGFTPNSVVNWNSNSRPTTFVSETSLQATIPARDLAVSGSATVEIVNPINDGGSSNSWAIPIANITTQVGNTSLNDLIWDPIYQVIYASIPSSSGAIGNSIAVIDASNGTILNSVYAGSEPNTLALSDNSQFLYVGLDGGSFIKRFTLPDLAPDILIPLGTHPAFGPYTASDIQVAPGSPRTIAVVPAIKALSPSSLGGVVIFDDATPRTVQASYPGIYSSIQWGKDASRIYSVNNESSSFEYTIFNVNNTGIFASSSIPSVISNFGSAIHYNPVSDLIFSDSGQVITPTTGVVQHTFPGSGRIEIDIDRDLLYFADSKPLQESNKIYLSSFHVSAFTSAGSATVAWGLANTQVNRPRRLMKTHTATLAMGGNGLPVFILNGPFVNGQ